jgi:hypothetical protein
MDHTRVVSECRKVAEIIEGAMGPGRLDELHIRLEEDVVYLATFQGAVDEEGWGRNVRGWHGGGCLQVSWR